MTYSLLFKANNQPWNKGMIIGPKPPLKLKDHYFLRPITSPGIKA